MTADELLAELGARMSLSGAVFDDNRACRLSFDGRLHVDLEAPTTARTLNAFGVVGPVPPSQSAAFYEHLLESNLRRMENRGRRSRSIPCRGNWCCANRSSLSRPPSMNC